MNKEKANAIIAEQVQICLNLLISKGQEYDADTSDRLHSFKVAAELQRVTPLQALAGMMAKHTVSIYDMCTENDTNKAKWEEKITDSINYLLLLKCLLEETNGAHNTIFEQEVTHEEN